MFEYDHQKQRAVREQHLEDPLEQEIDTEWQHDRERHEPAEIAEPEHQRQDEDHQPGCRDHAHQMDEWNEDDESRNHRERTNPCRRYRIGIGAIAPEECAQSETHSARGDQERGEHREECRGAHIAQGMKAGVRDVHGKGDQHSNADGQHYRSRDQITNCLAHRRSITRESRPICPLGRRWRNADTEWPIVPPRWRIIGAV